MKAQGASEENIRKATIDGMIQERDLTIKALSETQDVIRKLYKNRGKNDEENNKEIERALKKKKELEETYKDQTSAIKVAELNNITEVNKKITSDNQKRVDDNKKIREQEINDEKTAAQMLLELRKENALASIKDERERQYKELELQGATEEQIRKATIKGMIDERDLTIKSLSETQDVIRKLQKNRGKNDEENNKEIAACVKKACGL